MISRLRPFALPVVTRAGSSLNPAAPYVNVENRPISSIASSSLLCLLPAVQSTKPISLNFRRIPATMTTEYKLSFQDDPNDIPNGHKVEVEVDGIEGGKVLLMKVNGNLRALNPRCTRTSFLNPLLGTATS